MNIVFLNIGFYVDKDQIYVRSHKKDLINLIKRGLNLGLNIGGKKDVLGAIVPKKMTNSFLKDIIKYLK